MTFTLAPAARTLICALAVGCTVTTGSSGACSTDSMVSCTGTSIGYSCRANATPVESNESLICSGGVSGPPGATLYCCETMTSATLDSGAAVPPDSGGGCSPLPGPAGCPANLTEYSCPGSALPAQSNPSLTCGPGIAGSGGTSSFLYCCGTTDAGPAGSVVDAGTTDATSADGGSPDVGATDVGAGDAGGADAGMCPVATKTSSTACDQCLGSMCCPSLVSCDAPDNAGVDDAGMTACEQLLGCIRDCITGNPDAGVAPDTRANCQMFCGPTYTQTEQQNASSVLDCLSTSCSALCQ